MTPLLGFVKGDSLGVVVLVQGFHTVRELGERLRSAASPRVRLPPAAQVWFHGRMLDPSATVAEAGLRPLDRVDLVPEVERGA